MAAMADAAERSTWRPSLPQPRRPDRAPAPPAPAAMRPGSRHRPCGVLASRTMRWLAVLLAAAGLGIPTVAAAAGASGATHANAAAAGAASLTLKASNVNGSVGAVVSDAPWRVSGVVATYQAGQRVTLHVFTNGLRVANRKLAVHRA